VIVSDDVPLILPELAVIVVTPEAIPVASPPVLMLAISGAEELHITESVTFLLLPSLNVPMAVNCSVVPTTSEGSGGPTTIDTRVGTTFTERVVAPFTPPEVAVMVVVPGAMPVARPAALIAATSIAEEVQLTPGRLRVLPSPNIPIAVSWMVAPTAIGGFAGVTAMDVNLFAEELDIPEHAHMDTAAAIAAEVQNPRTAHARTFRDTTPPCGLEKSPRPCSLGD
jgi:hypothetical protein